MNSWIRKSAFISERYFTTSCSSEIFLTIQPRSPRSGLKITGKSNPCSRIVPSTVDGVAGNLIRDDLGLYSGGNLARTSNLDSPNIPPMRMPGFEAEKKKSEPLFSDCQS